LVWTEKVLSFFTFQLFQYISQIPHTYLSPSDFATPIAVEFPVIPDDIVPYVHVGIGNPGDTDLKATRSSLSKLQSLCETYRLTLEPTSSARTLAAIKPRPVSVQQLFLERKLGSLQDRCARISRQIHATIFNSIAVTCIFIEKALQNNISVTIDLESIEKLETEAIEGNLTFQKCRKRADLLSSHLEFGIGSLPRVTGEICASLLESNAAQADVQKGFAYQSSFDDALWDFCVKHGIKKLDKIARALSPYIAGRECEAPAPVGFPFAVVPLITGKRATPCRIPGAVKNPNPYPFLEFYLTLVNRFHADTTEKQLVLKSALIRIVADRLYLIDPILRTSDVAVNKTITIIQQLTIGDMQASALPFGVTPDVVIGKLGESNQVMKAVSHYIEALEFDRSPLDLAEKLSMVCATIDGMSGSLGKSMEISFDDFFATFFVMFSVCPPVNVTGIAHWLLVFDFLEYTSRFKHAITSFCAWASFLEGFLNEQHPPELRQKIDGILAELG
jgi:hypothetical protein